MGADGTKCLLRPSLTARGHGDFSPIHIVHLLNSDNYMVEFCLRRTMHDNIGLLAGESDVTIITSRKCAIRYLGARREPNIS